MPLPDEITLSFQIEGRTYSWVATAPPLVTGSALLLETGERLLTEAGAALLLE